MPRNVRKVRTAKKGYGRGRTYRRASRYRRSGYRTLSRRISAVSRRVAGEVCKFESTPHDYTNCLITGVPYPSSGTTQFYYIQGSTQYPLDTISSGVPWVMPINWIYQGAGFSQTISKLNYDGGPVISPVTNDPTGLTLSCRNPIWFNTYGAATISTPVSEAPLEGMRSPGFQYRLKYLYIKGLFNASVSNSVNNTDGALRIVIIKDKQPTGGAATWADLSSDTNSRGVFNANRIDAQLNPNTVGRFKIMYDKTLRFNTINGYKPFQYFKRLSSIVRNNRDVVTAGSITSDDPNNYETSSRPPPVQKNAYYLMMFSDGLTFNYSTESATPAASFHIFNRVSYYDN